MGDDPARCRVSCHRRDPQRRDRSSAHRSTRSSVAIPWFDETRRVVRGSPAGRGGSSDRRRLHRLARARASTARDPSVIISLARQAAQALDRAQLFEREQASAEQAAQAPGGDRGALEGRHARGREPDVSRVRGGRGRGLGGARRAAAPESDGDAEHGRRDRRGRRSSPRTMRSRRPAAAAPIAECMSSGRPASSADGWIGVPPRKRGPRPPLALGTGARGGRSGVARDARESGRAGARPGGTLRDRARRSPRRCSGASFRSASRRCTASRSPPATCRARSASTSAATGTT